MLLSVIVLDMRQFMPEDKSTSRSFESLIQFLRIISRIGPFPNSCARRATPVSSVATLESRQEFSRFSQSCAPVPNASPKSVELFVQDQYVNALRSRIDNSHGSVARMFNHVLQFGGKRCHGSSIPENVGKCSDQFSLTGNAGRNLVSQCLRPDD